jgi:AraC-like DNA-binding protein
MSRVVAAYDGKIKERDILVGEALFTGKNGWAYIPTENYPKNIYRSSISVVFMESHIRLVHTRSYNDNILFHPWFHTSCGPGDISKNILQSLNKLMFETHADRQTRAILLIKALLYQVIEEVNNDSAMEMSKSEKNFRNIIEYTQQYYHYPINRASVCNELQLSTSSLTRIFREHSKLNFNAYLNELRMKKAEFILGNYDLSVERIADQCGFASSGYFIKAFKKYFGVTPEVFRNLNK